LGRPEIGIDSGAEVKKEPTSNGVGSLRG